MAEQITVIINTKGPAFARDPNAEVARLLRLAADRIELGQEALPLRDVNGNTAGTISIRPIT